MPKSKIVDELLQIVSAAEALAPEPTAEELALEAFREKTRQERQRELDQVGSAEQVQHAQTDDLDFSLVTTGRANFTPNAPGVLGGKRDELAEGLSEQSAREVLDGMERATRLNQMLENERRGGKPAPLSHAVSGHGKDSDQVSRLVSGRRNDQLGSEARDLAEAQQLKAERVEELERRKRVLAAKDEQLKKQELRLNLGKPSTVSDSAWDEENKRFQSEKLQLAKDQQQLQTDNRKWKETEKRLNEIVRKAEDALLLAQSSPSSHVDLPVPEGIQGHIEKQTTVGDDPSNVSGAFSTNQGMLHAVQEGFAQANMVSGYADQQARDKSTPESGRIDEQRFVTNVTGRGDEELGYNLEVKGVSEQRAPKKGETVGLASDEMQERAKLIEKTDNLQNARVVLDPAYVDGRRVGWNLQTAYANSDAPSDPINNPNQIAGSLLEAEMIRSGHQQQLKSCLNDQKKKTSALAKAQNELANATNDIAFYLQEAGKIPADPQARGLGELKKGAGQNKGKIDQLKKNAVLTTEQQQQLQSLEVESQQLQEWLKRADYESQSNRLQSRLGELTVKVSTAQLALKEAIDQTQLAKQYVELSKSEVSKLQPVESVESPDLDSQESDEDQIAEEDIRGGTAGYDPTTGRWDGGRPAKPSGSLKGTDENDQSLTAHHINPWNKIRDALNSALQGNATKLQEFLDFAEVKVEPWFWTELAKPPAARSYKFSEAINRMGADICWSPKNIFMGPLGETRGDDPGEELDTAFTTGGLPTMQSAAGVLTGQTGGIGATPNEFNAQTQSRIEAKYRKKLPDGQEDLSLLSTELQQAMKKEMVDADVWEFVREDYPNVVAKNRKRTQVEVEYQRLEQQYMLAAKVSTPEELPSEIAGKLYEDISKFEAELPEIQLTADDLSPTELQALDEQMVGLGEGYELAKQMFLDLHGASSDAELNDEQREALRSFLADYKNPKQKLAEMVNARARQSQGSDEVLPNEARPYDPQEWETNESGKKVLKKMVQAPPALRAIMEKVDRALKLKVSSQTPVLRPSKPIQGVEPPPLPKLLQSDYQLVIDQLELVKVEWESELETFRSAPVSEGVSNAEILQRYPPAGQASSALDDRLRTLRQQRDTAPTT